LSGSSPNILDLNRSDRALAGFVSELVTKPAPKPVPEFRRMIIKLEAGRFPKPVVGGLQVLSVVGSPFVLLEVLVPGFGITWFTLEAAEFSSNGILVPSETKRLPDAGLLLVSLDVLVPQAKGLYPNRPVIRVGEGTCVSDVLNSSLSLSVTVCDAFRGMIVLVMFHVANYSIIEEIAGIVCIFMLARAVEASWQANGLFVHLCCKASLANILSLGVGCIRDTMNSTSS
jgi:hypothetical protein